MKLIIGGSSSTGSSLLNHCLGRHSDVITSPETSLFARPQLVTHWDGYKHRILNWSKLRPLRSHGWHRENGISVPNDSWCVTDEEIELFIKQSADYDSLINRLESSIKERNQGLIWVEKTPANALNMPALSNVLSEVQFIIMVRHPLEAIASMIRRGYDALDACAIFLLNSSFALSTDSVRYRVIRYEEFLHQYQKVTEELLITAGLDPQKIDWVSSSNIVKIDSWRYAEDELPQSVVHDRFQSLSSDHQEEVLGLVCSLRIKESFRIAGMSALHLDIRSVAHATGYELPMIDNATRIKSNKRKLSKSLVWRTALMDPINIFNTPFEIIHP